MAATAYAALVHLVHILERIKRHTRFPISFDQKQMESLQDKVNSLIEFLETSTSSYGDHEEVNGLASRIADAAHEAEDIIETHVVDKIITATTIVADHATEDIIETHVVDMITATTRSGARKSYFKVFRRAKSLFAKKFRDRLSKKMQIQNLKGNNRPPSPSPSPPRATTKGETTEYASAHLSCLAGLDQVIKNMDYLITEEVMKIKKGKGRADLQHGVLIVADSPRSIPFGKDTMVGLNDESDQLIDRLVRYDQRDRQIIPITGMGGIGKTTLARYVYEKQSIGRHFDFRGWVSVSQDYSRRNILSEILKHGTGLGSIDFNKMSEHELGEHLHKALYGRRYLVVLDDVWSVEAWETVQMFFPDNRNGSRIIITTRLSIVASHFDHCSLEMKLLDEEKGWCLFCEKMFPPEIGISRELEPIGRRIVKNCKGLPLSICVIGGLLAETERTKEYWEYVAGNTSSIIGSEDNEHCMKILSLSYQDLPVHLKPCFLYMGVFPEDHIIRVSKLIKLWVGEGFLKPDDSQELEVVGEGYIYDLVSRNLIHVSKRGSDGRIRCCIVHDLLRDLCLREAHKEKFYYTPNMHNREIVQGNSYRRIIIHGSQFMKKCISQASDATTSNLFPRSLICEEEVDLRLDCFRLLRVLKIDGKSLRRNDDIFELVNARYTEFKSKRNTAFPPSLCLLWNLQVSIVRVAGLYVMTMPTEVWEMGELRHLIFDGLVYLPEPPSDMQHSATMKNLQTLKGIRNLRFSEEVIKRIPNIKTLQISYSDPEDLDKHCLKDLGLMEKLESLSCSFLTEIQPGCIRLPTNLAFPCSLKKLTLKGCQLDWEEMTIIGSLPHLQVLKLKYEAFTGPEWAPVEGEFQSLRYLLVADCKMVSWKAESTHFPCLQHLVLQKLYHLEEIPSDIGEIPTLQSISVKLCRDPLVISAKEILQEQHDLGNSSIQVRVMIYRDSVLKRLASDNFHVEHPTW